MSSRRSLEEAIETSKHHESHAHFEFYRLLKNTILQKPTYQNTRFVDIVPEFPIAIGRADIVVLVSRLDPTKLEPFLIAEMKRRVHYRVGQSMTAAVKRALQYATNISASYPFAAVHDGWNLLVFRKVPPYLVVGCGAIGTESEARNLLLGLEEYVYTEKMEQLRGLPKHPDPEFLFKQVFRFVAKLFARDSIEAKNLLDKWRERVLQ